MRPAAPLLLLVAALAGCSSSSAAPRAAVDRLTPTPAAVRATPTSSPSAAPAATARPTPTAAGAASGTAAPERASSAPRPTGAPAPSRAAAPGSYTYDTTGKVSYLGSTQDASGTATLTVGALTAGAQHTTLKASQSTTDEQLVPRSTGTYLSDLAITTPLFSVEFQPSPAAVLVPAPARVGAAWSWQATSTDGKTTATQTSKVVRTETVVIGGQRVPTVVIQTHLVLSGGVDYTTDITNWLSPDHHVVVKDHQVGKGTSGGLSYSNDLTDVMRSVTPA